MIEYFARKTFHFLRIGRERIKTCGLSFETSLLFSASSRFLGKDVRPFAHGVTHCFLISTALRANGHAPAHRAHSEFEILVFTLHLHPQFADTALVVCEGKTLFLPSRVKEKGVKTSHASRSIRVSYRRMVKR